MKHFLRAMLSRQGGSCGCSLGTSLRSVYSSFVSNSFFVSECGTAKSLSMQLVVRIFFYLIDEMPFF
jgi:hypothetical protein